MRDLIKRKRSFIKRVEMSRKMRDDMPAQPIESIRSDSAGDFSAKIQLIAENAVARPGAACFTHLAWKRGCRLTRIVRAKRNPRRGLRANVQTAGAGDGDRVRPVCPFISRFVECPDTSFIYRWLAFFQDAASRVLTRNVFIMRSASKLRARRADRHCRRSRCGEAGPPLFAPASIKQISRDLRRVTKHTRADRLVKTPSTAVLHSSARFSCPGRFHSCSETVSRLARRAAERIAERQRERERERDDDERSADVEYAENIRRSNVALLRRIRRESFTNRRCRR